MIISLTGFMGSGKSSVGRRLAALMPGFELVDLDEYIEGHEGMSVSGIFEESGERQFREIELVCLEEILSSRDDIIISLGGGTVMNPDCEAAVHSRTLCFYLKATPETIRRNLSLSSRRPLLGDGLDKVDGLLEFRSPIYERVAHETIVCDGKYPIQVAREIYSSVFRIDDPGKEKCVTGD